MSAPQIWSFTSNIWCVITEILWKSLTLASRLLKSLKVIGTDTDRSATYDFLLVFHSNYGPNALYEIRGEKRIIAKVPHVCIFNAAAEAVPLEYCNGGGAEKYTDALPDRQNNIALCMLTRCKKFSQLVAFKKAQTPLN